MTKTLAFDVYGTLIDTHSVTTLLQEWIGDNASVFSQTWRNKQLEYSFRIGLMKQYQPFTVCTREALDYACEFHQVTLSLEQRVQLLESYRRLPAFPEVRPALEALKQRGYKMVAFSNGERSAVESLLQHAEIMDCFDDVVSCEAIESYKPDPSVYQYLLDKTSTVPEQTWLVSSNSFDVIGAISSGLKAVWVKRNSLAILDPWGVEPTRVIATLHDLD
ncbi:haloacid dehalogenase, type II [Vibrio sp. 10N.286.49.C2]|uniref:haloacid dehalogenase type II n=1 Tax=unclassified Vibrio TaxID=2614977 RepID=UPI000C843D64|nr:MULTISPECIES: haloacid dehalogenase type II [unclassified Vibrio]PMH36733.1 haloacid dehalogenase, type II [Vibrio sp. 10N.286.49.C2]PMH54721.1 haloacid dehalogenase, type II [Vibrio sp. 10N.286.49.B1]PMH80959.1 haloacid dehalogenase, type II [Vibrio sp. 10N.286.48.B7]